MIRLLYLLLVPILFNACSNEEVELKNVDNNKVKTEIKQDNNIENQKRIEEETKKQITHLERIIEQNKSKLSEYEIMISNGDTNEIKGLPQFVEDMKSAIKKKEERLNKLRKY